MTDHWKVEQGDCRDIMRILPDNSVDAIVSDPPYGLSFMGKAWDHGVPGVEFWTEALRVAKPGAHLVAFGGTRTYHRLAVAIEDAGWEVRDCLSYLYGSGFPKSLAVDKAIDKIAPRVGMFDAFASHFRERLKLSGLTQKDVARHFPSKSGGLTGCVWNWANAANVPTLAQWKILSPMLALSDEWLPLIERIAAEREVVGQKDSNLLAVAPGQDNDRSATTLDITAPAPATDAAKRWHGWGTALKPAWEPIILARKPLTGTVAANVTQYGTGAINVDGCRIGTTVETWPASRRQYPVSGVQPGGNAEGYTTETGNPPPGRWPANVLLDEDAAGLLGEPSRFFYTAKVSRKEREAGLDGMPTKTSAKLCDTGYESDTRFDGQPQPKTANHHPTVKPIALMRWLCRLVTPPNGLILDPFNGSGSTGCAAVLDGFRYLGCELEAEYVEIARRRIAYWEGQKTQPDLFND